MPSCTPIKTLRHNVVIYTCATLYPLPGRATITMMPWYVSIQFVHLNLNVMHNCNKQPLLELSTMDGSCIWCGGKGGTYGGVLCLVLCHFWGK